MLFIIKFKFCLKLAIELNDEKDEEEKTKHFQKRKQ